MSRRGAGRSGRQPKRAAEKYGKKGTPRPRKTCKQGSPSSAGPGPEESRLGGENVEWSGTKVHAFLDMYKQLEDELEDKYRHARRKCSSVVFEFTKDPESAPIRDKLNVCRELRNLLTHNANLKGIPVAEPSVPLMEAMQEILDFVRKPPLALEFATRGEQVMKASTHQKVMRVMEVMDKNGFSHIPVMNNGTFLGVFSSGVIMRYLLGSRGEGITPDTTIGDLRDYISVEKHAENYEFVAKDTSYLTVREMFEKVKGRNQRVSVIFITEQGRQDQKLLGVLTPWDVLGNLD
ncbi:CBS domain-containing protein [Neglecta sp. X4]|uniref:CBS domain-containing protein n=1 Tax=unclassified Neglectibacter TaxID=2632164 RepID=UPI00136EC80D|nr:MULTISPECIES: CBS domain-containing protein [unclassified Neglectibacter]NBI18463.1 CBS domain-containing protein [Neglectibacter sp. 59]NBJ74408.1 CBS domain-containing protein [Neglectibacter sp. X4]NCE80424.1 CBS domain-containing protein [Neglectibacter sp. X58]